MKKPLKSTFIGLLLLFLTLAMCAQQQVNNLYFIENTPIRHKINPAFQPQNDFYIGVPFAGCSTFNIGNNSFAASSLMKSKLEFYDNVYPVTLINAQSQISIIDVGFKHKEAFWNFGISTNLDANIEVPKDMVKFMLYGNANFINGQPQLTNNILNFQKFSMEANLITEISAGYSRTFDKKWSVGATLKYLYGTGNISAQFENFDLASGVDEWKINANGTINIATPLNINIQKDLSSVTIKNPTNFGSYLSPIGTGGALDLGATYKPYDNILLGLSITNLGFISWNNKVNKVGVSFDYTLNDSKQFTSNSYENLISQALIDTILLKLKDASILTTSYHSYKNMISPTLNASVEYGFQDTPISLGLLSTTTFRNSSVYQDITTSLNYRPKDWLNMVLSYSLLNGRGSNVGLGMGAKIGIVNIFFSTDYIPLIYTNIPTSLFANSDSTSYPTQTTTPNYIRLPYNTNKLNFAFGINLVFDKIKKNSNNEIK